eukprot:2819456-Lingulodinium_polyedra.AAC.1
MRGHCEVDDPPASNTLASALILRGGQHFTRHSLKPVPAFSTGLGSSANHPAPRRAASTP